MFVCEYTVYTIGARTSVHPASIVDFKFLSTFLNIIRHKTVSIRLKTEKSYKGDVNHSIIIGASAHSGSPYLMSRE